MTPGALTPDAPPLPPEDQAALERAAEIMRSPRLAIRLATLAGKPLEGAMKLLPKADGMLHRAVHRAMLECLTLAIESRDGQNFVPSTWRGKALTGLTGGIGGFFGGMFLPLELPLTITLMLRGIVDIAAHEGEDLSSLEARLACIQVFALTERQQGAQAAMGYYAVRATLHRLTGNVIAAVAERGTLDASTPVVTRLIAEIVGRFGFVLTERAAAGALPIIGMLTGSALNVAFMDHFERVAKAHFTLRRLERQYGAKLVERLYLRAAG
jgi:hypothetical protein